MFKFKDIIEGLFDDLLELPGSWFRTHWLLLRYGAIGFFRIEGRAGAELGGYLRLRTAAFVDLLLVLAFGAADNAWRSDDSKSFWEHFFSGFVELFSDPFHNAELVRTSLIFFIAYYAYYVILALTGLRRVNTHLLAGGALLCTVFSFCVLALLSLWAFATPLPLELHTEEALVAIVAHLFAASLFLRFGRPIVNLLGWRHRSRPKLRGAFVGALLFVTYLCVLYAYGRMTADSGMAMLVPSLGI